MQQTSEVPEGWVSAELQDGLLKNIQTGFACGAHNLSGEGTPHLRPMNVSIDGEIDLSTLKYVPNSKVDRDSKLVKFGDVIFNNTNSPDLVGKTAYYDLQDEKAFSNHMTRLRCNTDILSPKYLAIYLHHLWKEGYFKSICNNHVSQSSISRTVLLETSILFPPLAEQHRIVAAIEALFARLDAAEARLERVPGIVHQFRQSVLAAACDGRLTEEWRVIESNIEPNVFICEHENQKHILNIPNGWKLVTIENILRNTKSLSYGILKPGKFDPFGIPMVRVMDIGDFDVNNTEIFKVAPEIANNYQRTFLEPGDILLAIMATVGRCIVVPPEFAGHNVNRALAVIKIKEEIDPHYICNVIRSPVFQDKFTNEKIGSAQPRINIKDLRRFLLPLPPLPEQHEIVRRINSLFALADQIEANVAVAKDRTAKLRQSILAQAYSGQLVPTEAELARREGREYEPAAVLLERINSEVGPQGKGNKKSKKKNSV